MLRKVVKVLDQAVTVLFFIAITAFEYIDGKLSRWKYTREAMALIHLIQLHSILLARKILGRDRDG